MNIVIVHLKRSGLKVDQSLLFKVDRSTPLGNTASHLEKSKAQVKTKTVDEAVAYFRTDLPRIYHTVDGAKYYLNHIYNVAKNNPTIYLGCWCMDELETRPHDHNCHATEIRSVCMKRYKRETNAN